MKTLDGAKEPQPTYLLCRIKMTSNYETFEKMKVYSCKVILLEFSNGCEVSRASDESDGVPPSRMESDRVPPTPSDLVRPGRTKSDGVAGT